jgi:sorbitol/mannitol transport system substrate-binding protein
MHARFRTSACTAAITLCLLQALHARADNIVVLATGERPPYVGASLPEGGYVAELVTEAFRRGGYRVQWQYVSWARARLLASQGDVAGMVASDAATSTPAEFVHTRHFLGGSTGLLKKRALALPATPALPRQPEALFKTLAPYRFGAVRDGVSLPAFDAAGYLNKQYSASDLQTLDLLDQGQVQLALVDKYTAADLMVSQRPGLIGQLEFMTPPLAASDFHLALSTRVKNHGQLLAAFNAGLEQLRHDGTFERIANRHGLFPPKQARADQVQLTIGTVNNSDMIVMRRLSQEFERRHPGIALDWRVMDENTLRQRLLGDLAIGDGRFDVMTIGTYELPIWIKRGWLAPIEHLPENYDLDDLLPSLRRHLSVDGRLYALPFYAESAMTYYRKDLFQHAGLRMPAQPSYGDIATLAARLHRPSDGVYGICLRGKPGWGENMAFVGMLAHAHGARWFDSAWRPELTSPAWRGAVDWYAAALGKYGPPGADKNGFNENLALFAQGHCAMWIDATVAAGILFDAKRSSVSAQLAFAPAPVVGGARNGTWLWSWTLAIPSSSPHKTEAAQFIAWATSRGYLQSVAASQGWIAVPPGTRRSTYANPLYLKAAPFARFVLDAIEHGPEQQSAGRPYIAVQYVSIPEFQVIADQTGQEMAKLLRGEQDAAKALKRSQNFALEHMQTDTSRP